MNILFLILYFFTNDLFPKSDSHIPDPHRSGADRTHLRNLVKIDSDYVPRAYELFTIADSIIEKRGYRQAVETLKKYGKFYTDPMDIGMFNQVMMTYEAINGNIPQALNYESLFNSKTESETFSFAESIVARSASDVIMRLVQNKQVVMFNEAHHRPQQRAFIRTLLKDFYKLGFRTLLVEAYLEDKDSLLNRRGYPIQQTGTYTKEPVFGQLLREASALGFNISSYDNDTVTCDSPEPFFCNNQREKVAAENIWSILRKDPKAKVLVAAGYSHIIKKSDDGWIKMAEQFKGLSGIDPFSIDLVGMSERSTPEFESKFYAAALKKFKLEEPSILIDSLTKQVFLKNYRPEQIDLQVVFPRTKYSYGYATWLSADYTKTYSVDLSKYARKPGDLFQVYVKNELEVQGKNAIPFLQFSIYESARLKILLPEKHIFQFVIDHGDKQTFVKSLF